MPVCPHDECPYDVQPPTAAEAHLLEAIVARLVPAFPDLDESEVRDAVACAHRDLQDARLQQFVPLLVERDAKADCRRRRMAGSTRDAGDGGDVRAAAPGALDPAGR